MKELTIEAKTENLSQVFGFLSGYMEESGCSKKDIRLCKLCIEEIFLNIAHYAYPSNIGNVTLMMELKEDGSSKQMIFIFTDSGIPYNPLEKDDPDLEVGLDEREVGGLGIFLVKQKMDELIYEYKDGQNVLQMTKLIA